MRTSLIFTILFVYSATTNARAAAPDAELALPHTPDERVDTSGVSPLLACMSAAHSDATKLEDGFLVARAKKPKKPKPIKAPAPKPAPKPATNPVPKPAPKPPVSPKPVPGNSKPSKSKTITPSTPIPTSSAKPTPEVSCKEIIRLAALGDTSTRGLQEFEENDTIRGPYTGGMATLAKRTRKAGTACKMTFNADEYPESGHALMV
jgi:outer membrane biosynthesis protein TonB